MLFRSSYKTTYNLQNGIVIISGKIDNADSKVVTIAFEDIIQGQAHYSQIIDSIDGSFQFVIDVFHPQDIRFSYQNKFLQLFVEPYDSLFLTFNKNDFNIDNFMIENVDFSGNNQRINQEIAKFNLFSTVPDFNPFCKNKSVELYLTELDQQIIKEFNELELFVIEKKPSSKFIQWARKNIIYHNANYLIDYKIYLETNNLPQTDSLFQTDLFPVNDQEGLISSMFGLHLMHYVQNIYLVNDHFITEYIKNKKYLEAYRESIENIIKSEPEGLTRDLMIYMVLTSLYDHSFNDFALLWEEGNKYIHNQLLISKLNEQLIQILSERDYGITYLKNVSEEYNQFIGDVFNHLLEQSKEKVCYINIWATWCSPCRAELPYLLELQDKFKKNDIELISICNGADKNAWRLLINENNIPGQHYYLDEEQTNLFRSKLNFPGYPTYMIIKDGKIINKNAPSPRTINIEDELIRINAL